MMPLLVLNMLPSLCYVIFVIAGATKQTLVQVRIIANYFCFVSNGIVWCADKMKKPAQGYPLISFNGSGCCFDMVIALS